LIFICILFVLGNIGNATTIVFGQKTYIDDRNYPGGPSAYFVEQSTNWSCVVANAVYIVNSWFQDGLLVYRFWTIWARNYYIVALPAMAFVTSTVLSAILIAELSEPGNTLWSTISINLAIPYWSISISMTVILTSLIAGRLLFMRYRLRKLMNMETPTPYVTVTAILVESAALYSINGLVFLISYGVNSPVQNLFISLLGQTQSIAPMLIILRVAQNQAWSADTETNLTAIRFGRAPDRKGTSTTVLAELSANTTGVEDSRDKPGDVESNIEFRENKV